MNPHAPADPPVWNHCPGLTEALGDPDVPICYDSRFRSVFCQYLQGGQAVLELSVCPFCGVAFPPSLRDEWFERIEELGLDPSSSDLPIEFQTGQWWGEPAPTEDCMAAIPAVSADRLAYLAAAVDPGLWRAMSLTARTEFFDQFIAVGDGDQRPEDVLITQDHEPVSDDIRRLVAGAVNHVPLLLAEIDRLTTETSRS